MKENPSIVPNADGFANRVRMRRRTETDACVLVEGLEDLVTYARIIATATCRLQWCKDRDTVLHVLDILERGGERGIVAIVDADYAWAEHVAPESANVVYTDWHDLEIGLLCSPALDCLLNAVGPRDEHAQLTTTASAVIRVVLDTAKYVGYLRWLSNLEGLGYKLSDVEFGEVLAADGRLDWERLVRFTQNVSRKGALDPDALRRRCARLAALGYDDRHICRGHDACAILAFHISYVWRSGPSTKREDIEKALMIAIRDVDFAATRLVAQLKAWEQANPPFVVLAVAV